MPELDSRLAGEAVELARADAVGEDDLQPPADAGRHGASESRERRGEVAVPAHGLELHEAPVRTAFRLEVAERGDPAVAEDEDLVAALLDVPEEVRREDDADLPRLPDLLDEPDHPLPRRRVEAVRRLVEEEDPRAVGDRLGQLRELLHPERVGLEVPVADLAEADGEERLVGPLERLGSRKARELREHGDVADARDPRDEGVVLGHVADRPPDLAALPHDVEALNLAIDLASILDDDSLVRTFSEQSFALAGSTVATNNGITGMMRSRDQARAVTMAREAIERFPGNADTAYQAQRVLLTAGRIREAAALVPVVLASDMLEDSKGVLLMRQACAERRRVDAQALYEQLVKNSPDALVRWHGLVLLGRDRDAAAQLEPYNRADTVYALSTMLVYPKFDARPFPALVAALESRGIAVRPARPEPYNCPAATPAN